MAYDEDLATRIRMALLADEREVEERKMFGGLCFMYKGHMIAGVAGDGDAGDLMLRCGETRASEGLNDPHARIMDFTGRPMKSMLIISNDGVRDDGDLMRWLALALDFIDTEPPKKKAKRKPKPRKLPV